MAGRPYVRRRDRYYAWLRVRPLLPDAVIAGVLFLLLAVPAAVTTDPRGPHLALGVAIYGALVVRRLLPVVSFAAVGLAGLVQWLAGIGMTVADAGILVAVYSISAFGPRWASRLGLVVGLVGAVLAGQQYVLGGAAASATAVGLLCAAVVGVWALGDVRRVRQAYVTELVERAKQAERERDQQAQLAAANERARIARDMHDVVAHNLSVIVAQADGGRYISESDPHRAVAVLDTIASTGRSALAEIRRLVGVMRNSRDAVDVATPHEPQPGLADIADLAASYRDAGLPVDVEVSGTAHPVAAGPSLAVYRAVQEALTNTLKHAGPGARATVRITYGGHGVAVAVTDDGQASPSESADIGHGLAGMRERLELYGADVTAGPATDGGWRVLVTMPAQAGSA